MSKLTAVQQAVQNRREDVAIRATIRSKRDVLTKNVHGNLDSKFIRYTPSEIEWIAGDVVSEQTHEGGTVTNVKEAQFKR